jgi:PAS domain S-box-containing protein
MIAGRQGARLVALKGGEPNYRMLVEAMSEGAATLSHNGAVLYCNRRFAELLGRTPVKVSGVAVQSFIAEAERDKFDALLVAARTTIAKGEFNLCRPDGSLIPVYLSLNRLRGFKGQAMSMVITDLSEQKRKQAAEMRQSESMHRLLLERTFAAQEEERRRIARELHDEAGQLMTALLVGLRSLEDTRKLADVKVHGRQLREIAGHAIDELGRLARGLHPSVLDDHGLEVALRRYVTEFQTTHEIAVDLTFNDLDSTQLPPAVQIGLYRILQEALTNVVRHSGAKTVGIHFTHSELALKVEISDDGCGFDAKAVTVSSHRLGIQGMRERAVLLGGTIKFAAQRKGTRVLVQVPLHPQAMRRII